MSTPTPSLSPTLPTRLADFTTLPEALLYAADGDTGLNFYSAKGELQQVMTYGQLSERAEAVAARMTAAGLKPGDRVAMLAATDPSLHIFFFACQYAGLIPVPLPIPHFFGRRDAYIDQIRIQVQSSKSRMLLGPANYAELITEAAEGLGLVLAGTLQDLEALPSGPFSLHQPKPEDLCYIQYSSGSTRFPMGVMITHENLMANCVAMNRDGVKNDTGERLVSWLPLYHDMGLVGFMLAGLTGQTSIDYLPPEDFARRPLTWLKLISQNKGTISYSPSFGFELCARRVEVRKDQDLDLDLSSWRVAGIGGEMIKPHMMQHFAEVFAPYGFSEKAFCASYGLAEVVLAISFATTESGMILDTVDRASLAEEHQAKAVPAGPDARTFVACGKVVPDHQIEIRDEAGQALGQRSVGRVWAKGPSIMQGYLDAPEINAEILVDGWLDTGDLGYWMEDELVIVGRAKDMMIVNGRNIWPQDIEWSVERLDGLRAGDVAAVALETGQTEETPSVLVHCRYSDGDARTELSTAIKDQVLEAVGIAFDVILVPPRSLPKTSSGKLARRKAKAMFEAGEIQPLA